MSVDEINAWSVLLENHGTLIVMVIIICGETIYSIVDRICSYRENNKNIKTKKQNNEE